MKTSFATLSAAGLVAAGVFFTAPAAQALTMQECSAKYNAAKAGNALAGKSWNDFRKSECGDTAAAAPAAPAATAPAARSRTATTPAPAAGNAVFPRAINAKYASEPASKQRMKTCLDQYNVNKTNGGNGDLKWIQKGGGYYSQCNARLKGQSGA
jgi:hypothetical protein